jgi:hypothetical protein
VGFDFAELRTALKDGGGPIVRTSNPTQPRARNGRLIPPERQIFAGDIDCFERVKFALGANCAAKHGAVWQEHHAGMRYVTIHDRMNSLE